jgi:hypothetical protein
MLDIYLSEFFFSEMVFKDSEAHRELTRSNYGRDGDILIYASVLIG